MKPSKLLFTDPLTMKKSLTITMMVISFLLFIASVILHFVGVLADWKIGIMILFPCGMFFGAYHQKRVKISFSGLELENDNVDKCKTS